jgi:citrate lyase subunit beta/citryl-CoA lyase
MDVTTLRLCRSLLFLPASNPRAIEKARGLEADMIVLDCEDAVRPDEKEAARAAAVAAVGSDFGGRPVAVRMNTDLRWFGADAVAFRDSPARLIVIPKVESVKQLHDASQLLQKPILAMIETASGVLNAGQLAPLTRGLIAGTNDLAADLELPADAGRTPLMHSLQTIVLAARAARVAAFDGVYNGLDDDEGLARQCVEGRSFGFDGKSLIHPKPDLDCQSDLLSERRGDRGGPRAHRGRKRWCRAISRQDDRKPARGAGARAASEGAPASGLREFRDLPFSVAPAQGEARAGAWSCAGVPGAAWIPAFAGMSVKAEAGRLPLKLARA